MLFFGFRFQHAHEFCDDNIHIEERMANVENFYPERNTVGTPQQGGTLANLFDADGFHMDLEESDDVIWTLRAINSGPKEVRAVYCKPFTSGPKQIVGLYPIPIGGTHVIHVWRADNDEHFFFLEINNAGGWVSMNDGNCVWKTDSETFANMVWQRPQYAVIEVRRKGT